MAKATRKSAPVTAPAPTAPAIAEAAAAKPTDSPSLLKMLDAKGIAAVKGTIADFGALSAAEWKIAESVQRLKAMGLHTAAKVNDFCTWLDRVTTEMGNRIPRASVDRYAGAAWTLDQCAVNADRLAEARSMSIDALNKIAGHARKATKNPEAAASIARTAVGHYSAEVAKGTPKAEAAIKAGFAKPKGADTAALDFNGRCSVVGERALSLADGNYEDAAKILAGALVILRAKQKTAAAVASGIGS